MAKSKQLSKNELEFVQNHITDPEWTDDRIAQAIDRNIETVKKYRKQFGVHKGQGGKVKSESIKLDKSKINKSNLTNEEKIQAWKNYFKTTERYTKVSKEFITDDLKYFVHKWAEYCLQFEDMTATEEATLETLIQVELLISGNRVNYKKCLEEQNRIENELKGRELDVENEVDVMLRETAMSYNRFIQDLSKEFQALAERHSKTMKDLNATREQREQKHQISGDSFLSLVQEMNDEDRRKDIGKYNELLKISTDKKERELKQAHEFPDGSFRPVIQTGKDYTKKEVVKDE